MEINVIIQAVLTVIVALVYFGFQKYVKPWLEQNNLLTAAQIAVNAAEAMYGRYNGDEKLQEALNQLKAKGFDVSLDEVKNAVEAAWKQLDTAQIAAGEKTATEDTVEAETEN